MFLKKVNKIELKSRKYKKQCQEKEYIKSLTNFM